MASCALCGNRSNAIRVALVRKDKARITATVGYPYPFDKTYPMIDGPTNPPRFPTELMSPIEAAAADSVRNSLGTGQKAGWKPKYAPPTPTKKRIASRR